jgi:hypothetical protein
MRRALRRHHERLAKARRIRILLSHRAWVRDACGPKIWQSMQRLVMNEPGWCMHATVVQPARIKTHRLEQRILRGCDADLIPWPDCKRPHDYYW